MVNRRAVEGERNGIEQEIQASQQQRVGQQASARDKLCKLGLSKRSSRVVAKLMPARNCAESGFPHSSYRVSPAALFTRSSEVIGEIHFQRGRPV